MGSRCSVSPGSCCRAPDLAHTSSLAINQREKRNPEWSQQRLLAAKCLQDPARVHLTPGCPAAARSFSHPCEFRQRPPGSDARGDKGRQSAGRAQTAPVPSTQPTATRRDLSEQRWTGAPAAFGGTAEESSQTPSPAAGRGPALLRLMLPGAAACLGSPDGSAPAPSAAHARAPVVTGHCRHPSVP